MNATDTINKSVVKNELRSSPLHKTYSRPNILRAILSFISPPISFNKGLLSTQGRRIQMQLS